MIYLVLDNEGDYSLYCDNDSSTLSIYNFQSTTGSNYYVKALPPFIRSANFEPSTDYTYNIITNDPSGFIHLIATLFNTDDYYQFISTHPELLP